MSTRFEDLPRWRQVGRVAAVVLLVAAAALLLWYWPQRAAHDLELTRPPEDFTEELRHRVEVQQLENARREMGAQLFLALAVLAGVRLTLRRVRAMERRAQSAEEQVELGRRQQIAERFTQAIEQLGSAETSIRLGGIYALEKIAQDEPEAYFNQFREVLCAFVRETAQEPRDPLVKDLERGQHTPLPVDLQATLTVLVRNPPPHEVEKPAFIDWSGAHLEGAKLASAQLSGANLSDVDLLAADLQLAQLEHARFDSASLVGANLCGAQLGGADLRYADLSSAQLCAADLLGAHLEGADLSNTNFFNAQLVGDELHSSAYNNRTRFPKGMVVPDTAVNLDAQQPPDDEES